MCWASIGLHLNVCCVEQQQQYEKKNYVLKYLGLLELFVKRVREVNKYSELFDDKGSDHLTNEEALYIHIYIIVLSVVQFVKEV